MRFVFDSAEVEVGITVQYPVKICNVFIMAKVSQALEIYLFNISEICANILSLNIL